MLALTATPAYAEAPQDGSCANGCLYRHFRYQARTGPYYEYGIAYEYLPNGPDRREFVKVLWPAQYDPDRRPMWDQTAWCESRHQWHIDSRYDGGLQFSPATWNAYGGQEYAQYAYQATPEQQIAIAERVLRHGHGPHRPQGKGAWPHCGKNLRS